MVKKTNSEGENKEFDSRWLWIILWLLLAKKDNNLNEEKAEENIKEEKAEMDMNEIYKIEHEVITSAFLFDNPKMEDREKDAARLAAAMTANIFAQKIIINEEIKNGKKVGLDLKEGLKDFLEEQIKGHTIAMPGKEDSCNSEQGV